MQPLATPHPSEIGPPESYKTVETLLHMVPGPGSDIRLESIERMTRNLMFEIRPEDPLFFASKSDEWKPTRIWSRLRPQLAGKSVEGKHTHKQ